MWIAAWSILLLFELLTVGIIYGVLIGGWAKWML